MPINQNEITKEMIAKAMQCETAEELVALAKAGGINITKEEAEVYLTELEDFELDDESLQNIAGGSRFYSAMGGVINGIGKVLKNS